MTDKEYPRYFVYVHDDDDKDYFKVHQQRYVRILDWDDYGGSSVVEFYIDNFEYKGVQRCSQEEFEEVLSYLPGVPESVKQAIIDDNGV